MYNMYLPYFKNFECMISEFFLILKYLFNMKISLNFKLTHIQL